MEVDDVTLKGIMVNTHHEEDDDMDPATPPIIHENHVEDLGSPRVAMNIAMKAEIGDPSVKGVISVVFLWNIESC